jgi:hypothetical protein
MASNGLAPFRVDIRPIQLSEFCEYVGRVQDVTSTGCSVMSSYDPDAGAILELRLYLAGTSWPLAVRRAQVTSGHWDSFTVEFQDDATCRTVATYLAQLQREAA